MIFSGLKAIIFDLDDTLFRERDYAKSGFFAVSDFCHYHFNVSREYIFEYLWTKFSNGERKYLFNQLISDTTDLDVSVNKLVTVYREHKPNIHPIDGVEKLLNKLKKDKKTAILSDGFLKTQQLKLEALKINNLFDYVMFTDTLGDENWKPSPKPYLKVLDRLCVHPGESVYIGDNPLKDFIFPNKSGMKSIRIKYVDGIFSDLEPESSSHSPMLTVNNIEDLKNILLYG